MNLRKHLAGFLVFSVIVASAIFVHAYLTAPVATFPPLPIKESGPAPVLEEAEAAREVKPRLVTLDFVNNQSHATLRLTRAPGSPAPEKLWVTTYFFVPGHAGSVWTTTAEIEEPFAAGDHIEVVASAMFLRDRSDDNYFARVYVSTDSRAWFPALSSINRDIASATPVVVQVNR